MNDHKSMLNIYISILETFILYFYWLIDHIFFIKKRNKKKVKN